MEEKWKISITKHKEAIATTLPRVKEVVMAAKRYVATTQYHLICKNTRKKIRIHTANAIENLETNEKSAGATRPASRKIKPRKRKEQQKKNKLK